MANSGMVQVFTKLFRPNYIKCGFIAFGLSNFYHLTALIPHKPSADNVPPFMIPSHCSGETQEAVGMQ
jgi:hypothetical protein